MIGPLTQIIRTANSFKNIPRYFCKVRRESNLCILQFYWLISLHLFTPLPRKRIFLIVKHSCVREALSDVVFFLQTQLQQLTVQEHLFGEFSLVHLTFGSCTSPTDTFTFTYHPFNFRAMCAVDDFERLRFGNSQSHNKFTGKPKIVSHLTSSQESLKQKVNVYIYIAHHIQGQWHSPISPQTARTPFLDIYYCHMTCPTHIRPSCLTTNHPLNMLQ